MPLANFCIPVGVSPSVAAICASRFTSTALEDPVRFLNAYVLPPDRTITIARDGEEAAASGRPRPAFAATPVAAPSTNLS
jgi:hypothetical protein